MRRTRSTLAILFAPLALGAQPSGEVLQRALPAPTGTHPVGTRRYVWTDSTRPEIGTPDPSDKRAIAVRMWYPATARTGQKAPYLPELEGYRAAGVIGPRVSALLAAVQHSSLADAPVAAGRRKWPLILFSPGNGELEYIYTALAQELASHGFVFVLVANPGVSDVALGERGVLRRYARLYDPKPAGWEASLPATLPVNLKRALYDTMYTEAAEYLTRDVRFALDNLMRLHGEAAGPFSQRLDAGRVVTLGHSYGGNVAIEACATDTRVKACAQFDGGAFGPVRENGLAKPYMLIRPAFVNAGYPRGLAQDQIIGSLKADGFEVNIEGASHRSFMDAHFLDPATRGDAVDPGHVLRISSAYLRAFCEKYLGGADSPLLNDTSSPFRGTYVRILKSSAALRR